MQHRLLFVWELGANYGHLARLIPLAEAQRALGREVLFAVSDLQVAEKLLIPKDFSFVLILKIRTDGGNGIASNYAELLLNCGYSNKKALQLAVGEWLHLLRQYKPDLLVLDHSPTVLLANKIAKIPAIQIGAGFEMPPQDNWPEWIPLNVSQQIKLKQSELVLLINMNGVIESYSGQRLESIVDLFDGCNQLLTTFSELDHYQKRVNAQYLSPILYEVSAHSISWHSNKTKKVFIYVWPTMPGLNHLLGALSEMKMEVVAVIPNITELAINRFARMQIRIYKHAVDIAELAQEADLLITHGIGTANTFLCKGVPLLIIPETTEQLMLGQCIEKHGFGLAMSPRRGKVDFELILNTLLNAATYRDAAQKFAHKYKNLKSLDAINNVTQVINDTLMLQKMITN